MIDKKIEKIKDELAIRRAVSEEEYKSANENLKAQEKALEESYARSGKSWEEAAKRIDGTFADAWSGAFKSFTSFRDQMVDGVKKLAGEIIHQATTKKLTDALLNFSGRGNSPATKAWQMTPATLDNAFEAAPINKGASNGGGAGAMSGMLSGIGAGGFYALAAVAVVAAVGIWNKQQDEKFVKLSSDYKQANQGMSKVLGQGLVKSDTINKSIERLAKTGGEALGVNYNMLQALLDIRAGISDVAAGFAKTIIGGADYKTLGLKEGVSTKSTLDQGGYLTGKAAGMLSNIGLGSQDKELHGAVEQFVNNISNKVNTAIYNSKSKVVDAGIQVFAGNLIDIMKGGELEASNYADVRTTKKVIGINVSDKLKRSTEDLNDLFQKQFSEVFSNAGKALEISSKTFGINFNSKIDQLLIKKQDLSLKGLKGDELSKAIENFFGSQIDEWANVLLGGTDVLKDFQKIGESSFDTMIRLSSETEVFNQSASTLGLNFKATSMEAVYASQAMQEVAGGFDSLSSKLSNYYNKFFTNEEKSAAQKLQIDEQFKEMGIKMPATRKEFRDLVSSMDLLTASGREGANKLFDLVPLLDSYYTSIGDIQETSAKNNIMSAQQLLDFSKKTLDVADSLLVSDLSTLKPIEKLAESKKQFNAASGEDLGTAAQDYLKQARDFYASSSQYTEIFKEVQDRLRSEAANALGGKQPTTNDVINPVMMASTAIATQASNSVKDNSTVSNPLDSVVENLKSANESLTEQLKVQVVYLDEYRKQNKIVAAQSADAINTLTVLSRRVEDLVDITSRHGGSI